MPSDEQIETYLNAVAEYAELKARAGRAWQEAFLALAQARLSRAVSPHDHDPAEAATTAVRGGALVCVPSAALAGAWPPAALRTSQAAFVRALEQEVRARALQHDLPPL